MPGNDLTPNPSPPESREGGTLPNLVKIEMCYIDYKLIIYLLIATMKTRILTQIPITVQRTLVTLFYIFVKYFKYGKD